MKCYVGEMLVDFFTRPPPAHADSTKMRTTFGSNGFHLWLSEFFKGKRKEIFRHDTLKKGPTITMNERPLNFNKLVVKIDKGLEVKRFRGLKNGARSSRSIKEI